MVSLTMALLQRQMSCARQWKHGSEERAVRYTFEKPEDGKIYHLYP
jgi:hypothetical protein